MYVGQDRVKFLIDFQIPLGEMEGYNLYIQTHSQYTVFVFRTVVIWRASHVRGSVAGRFEARLLANALLAKLGSGE